MSLARRPHRGSGSAVAERPDPAALGLARCAPRTAPASERAGQSLYAHDRDTNGDGTLDERLYVAQDANYNITALFDNSGNVVERYVYDPFGQVMVLDAGWNTLATSAFGWLYLQQGGRLDAISGLYHFRFRDLLPDPRPLDQPGSIAV